MPNFFAFGFSTNSANFFINIYCHASTIAFLLSVKFEYSGNDCINIYINNNNAQITNNGKKGMLSIIVFIKTAIVAFPAINDHTEVVQFILSIDPVVTRLCVSVPMRFVITEYKSIPKTGKPEKVNIIPINRKQPHNRNTGSNAPLVPPLII